MKYELYEIPNTFPAPIYISDKEATVWQSVCKPGSPEYKDCPTYGPETGTYLRHPSIARRVDWHNRNRDRGTVDHYAFLTHDDDPADGVAGLAWIGTACLNGNV